MLWKTRLWAEPDFFPGFVHKKVLSQPYPFSPEKTRSIAKKGFCISDRMLPPPPACVFLKISLISYLS